MQIQPGTKFIKHPEKSETPSTALLDILVPTHNNLELTIECVKHLYAHTSTSFHLIIVDDSTDLTPLYFENLKKEKSNITYIHSKKPFKTGNQVFNTGFKYCKTPYIATVMNSVSVEPEWEIVALNLIQNDPKIGIIGFKCLFPNGLIESAGIAMTGYTPCDMGRDLPGWWLSKVYECQATQWAFALLRKEAVLGAIESNTFNGFVGWDDIDNCFVLRKNGWKIVYCGMGVGIHKPRSTRGNNSVGIYIKNRENAEIFFKRWGLWDEFAKSGQPKVAEIKKAKWAQDPNGQVMLIK